MLGWQRYKSQAVSGLAEVQEPGSVGLVELQEPGSVGAGSATRARQCRGWQRYKSQAVCRARQLLLIASPELGQGGVRMEKESACRVHSDVNRFLCLIDFFPALTL